MIEFATQKIIMLFSKQLHKFNKLSNFRVISDMIAQLNFKIDQKNDTIVQFTTVFVDKFQFHKILI